MKIIIKLNNIKNILIKKVNMYFENKVTIINAKNMLL